MSDRLFENLIKKILRRKENENKVKREGGNKFQQLEARLTDEESRKILEDPVIYAIRRIRNYDEARDFVKGYEQDIKLNPNKYLWRARGKPKGYVIIDILAALNLHFPSEETPDFGINF